MTKVVTGGLMLLLGGYLRTEVVNGRVILRLRWSLEGFAEGLGLLLG